MTTTQDTRKCLVKDSDDNATNDEDEVSAP